MSKTPGKRSHWPWWILLATIAVMAAPVAWRYRPLNATERLLVGTWLDKDDVRTTFSEQRRFVEPLCIAISSGSGDHRIPMDGFTSEGAWSASGGQLTMQSDPYEPDGPLHSRVAEYVLRWIGRDNKVVQPLRFDGDDQVWIGKVRMKRIRD